MFHMNILKLKRAKFFNYFVIFSLLFSNFSFNGNPIHAQEIPDDIPQCVVDEDCTFGEICNAGFCELSIEPEICDDGIDNDADGNIDCDDDECIQDPYCEIPECDIDDDCPTGEYCDAGFCELDDVPTYCGDGEHQSPNDAGNGGPSDDGYEDCDNGLANVDNQPPVYDAGGNGDRNYCSTSCVNYFVAGEYCGDGTINGPEQCDDGNTDDGDGCSSQCITEEEPDELTIKAAKIVCPTEEDLPNWGAGNVVSYIDENTAADFVANNPNCRFETDWDFQWGKGVSDPGKDFRGPAAAGWQNFDTATGNGTMAEVVIGAEAFSTGGTTVKLREVLPPNYHPFSYTGGQPNSPGSDVSAEFYCHTDVLNYDNFDFITGATLGEVYYCVAFNVLETGYCGDGVVNQDWEQCDPGRDSKSLGCTDQCQWEEQVECSDLVLARVNVHEYSNEGDGDLTDNVYLGSDSNVLPNGTWFPLYWMGAPYELDSDILGYEDVPGLAVQRLSNSVRIAMHASQGRDDVEIVDATLEFYNADATGYSSDGADNNKLENSGAHPDSVNVYDSQADFYLWANTGDDGFYVDWSIIEDCIDPYGNYCGDGEVNQEWEQCDPGEGSKSLGCTEQCQWERQQECSDLVLAKVNVDDVQNWGNGDMTSDLFLGSSSYMIPHDVWFALYWNGTYYTDPDLSGYEDVPGLAVQRLENSVRTVMHGTGTGDDKEHVSGHVEFYNATLEGQRSDNSNDYPKNNKLEKGFDGNGVGNYNAGNDEVWEDGEKSKFWLTTTSADDGYYSDWAIVEDCEEAIVVCKYDTEQNPLSGWEMTLYGDNLVTNGGFEYPKVNAHGGKWELFDSSEVDWDVKLVSDDSAGLLELQTNKLWTPYEGDHYAELDGNNPVKISQDINTIIGADYEVGFAFSARKNTSLDDNKLRLDFGSFSANVEADGSGNSDNDWTYFKYNHTALASSTVLEFSDLGLANGLGTMLDDVVVRQVTSGVTGDNGCVTFKDLPYGTYEVHETMQEGWTQVEPGDPGYFTVNFNSKNFRPTVSFVNQAPETYDIHGYKWNDENGNGERDCTLGVALLGDGGENFAQVIPQPTTCEEKMSGWTINLYEGRSTEPLMSMDTSDEDNDHFGWYWFENLPAGNYRICEVLQDGWTQTYPGDCHFITLPIVEESQRLTDNYVEQAPEYNFGNQEIPYEGTYCGDGSVQSPNDEGTGGPNNDGYEDCDTDGLESCTTDDGYSGLRSCRLPSNTLRAAVSEEVEEIYYCVWNPCRSEEFCGDGIVNGNEECDEDSDSCSSDCTINEDDNSGSGPGGFLNSGSGTFTPGQPSTPSEVLGEKIEAEPSEDSPEEEPTPEVLGMKTLPETGANSNVFYVNLFLGLMSLLAAGFVQLRRTEEN